MNNIQKLLHSPEIQEKLHIKSAHIPLSADKKRQLGNAYLKLYFGLSCANWANKKSLGASWQTALTQINNIINARDEKNPAVQFLRIMHTEHKSRWPKHIMTHPQRDSKFNGETKQLHEYAVRNIRSAMGEITLLSSQCKIEHSKDSQSSAQKQPIQVAAGFNKNKPEMSVVAKHKSPIPQTHNGEKIIAKPGINSATAPQQKTGLNSKQIAMRPVAPQRSLSQEAKDKEFAKQIKKAVNKPDLKQQFQQASGRVMDMTEIIRLQMLMQTRQKTA